MLRHIASHGIRFCALMQRHVTKFCIPSTFLDPLGLSIFVSKKTRMLAVAALLLVEEELVHVTWLAVEVDVKSGKIQIWHMYLFTEGKVHSLSQGGDNLREREIS